VNPTKPRGSLSRAVALLLLVPLFFPGCSDDEAATTTAAPIVIAIPVARRDLAIEIRATGELHAIDRADISAEVAGKVTQLIRDEGDTVTAGEIVILIDPQRWELEVASAEAAVAEAKAAHQEAVREHKRLLKLETQGAASSARLDSAATALEAAISRQRAAAAALGMANRSLDDSKVAAPFPGTIALTYVNRGEFVSPGTPLFILISSDPLEVIFHLSEVDSGRVAIGNPVSLGIAAYPEEAFIAKVSFISPEIDMRSRTLRVKAEVENLDGRLRPGLFAHVDLGVDVRHAVPMIPEEAILQRASGATVFVLLGDDRVERRAIRTGLHRDGEVEIITGLETGERVLTQGHLRLVDGMRVEPIAPDEPEADAAVVQIGFEGAAPQ
jgi:membrane fusion protein (multidrug efflux system)